MRQVPAEKYTIAWSKLAECIARGQEAQALGIFRLLSLSLNDQALAQQLSGDLALAFGNTKDALKRYEDAAKLYANSNRMFESVAIHKHILIINQ